MKLCFRTDEDNGPPQNTQETLFAKWFAWIRERNFDITIEYFGRNRQNSVPTLGYYNGLFDITIEYFGRNRKNSVPTLGYYNWLFDITI